MRVPLPNFLMRRLPSLRRTPARGDDPAGMGTEFGLDASIAGWSDDPAAQGAAGRAGGTSADDAPMHWLGGPAGRKPG